MANDPQTYAELKLSVEAWFLRDDVAERIPEFIALAERELARRVFTPEREALTTLSAAATVALPADFWGVRSIWLDTDPKVVLDSMSLNELMQTYSAAATGQPGNYAIVEGDTLYLGPSPDSAYSMKLAYWQKITPLDDSNTSNWLLLAHPDLYLAATLAEGFSWSRDEGREALWRGKVASKIDEIDNAGKRKQYGGAPFRIRSTVVV